MEALGKGAQISNVNKPREDDADEPAEDRATSFAKTCVMFLHALQASVDRQSLDIALTVRTVGSKEGQE